MIHSSPPYVQAVLNPPDTWCHYSPQALTDFRARLAAMYNVSLAATQKVTVEVKAALFLLKVLFGLSAWGALALITVLKSH